MSTSYTRAIAIKRLHAQRFMRLPGVKGVGVSQTPSGDYFIVLYLEVDDPAVRGGLPENVDGIQVQAEVVGRVVAG